MVVMDDADVDLAVEGALFGGFGTAGQRCTSLGTAIVHESVHDEFVAKLDERLRASPIGDPTAGRPVRADDPRALRRPLRGLARADRATTTRSTAPTAAGRDHRRQPARRASSATPRPGIFYHPAIVDGVTLDDEIYRTETFGPIVGVATFSTFDEAMELANGHGYGLSSSIYTTVGRRTRSASASASRAGMVSVNNSTSGAEAHLPFGGNGKSGNGSRQSGIWVLDQFTRWQSMNWDYAGKLQKAQMDHIETIRAATSGTGWRTSAAGGTSCGEVLGGGTSGSGVRATSTDGAGSLDVAGERLAERVVEAVDGLGARRRSDARERREVRRVQVDAEALLAGLVLVVAQHPVAAVVDDHGGQRDLLLRDRRELAAGEQEAAVAGDRDGRAVGPASAAPSAAGNA